MTQPIFLYGTLCDPALFAIVAGINLTGHPASLRDSAAFLVEGENFPVLSAASGTTAEGLLVRVDESVKRRLDFYELGFGYDLQTRRVHTGEEATEALLYIPDRDWPAGPRWSLVDWQDNHGVLARMAAEEYMGLIDTHDPTDAARAFPQILTRAASRLRALSSPSPATLPPVQDGRQVRSFETHRPYTDYFSVQEDHLSFPLFGGGLSTTVKRASYLGGDAVTVLPFDPKSGKVLLVRQFRHGPFARGDINPWTLEPAAGRIDATEAPEEAALRELREETGVSAGKLHFIGRYYPSPGAYSEFLFSYVVEANLDGFDRAIGGLDGEAEDIMAHVVTLEDALTMVETGEVNTAPLILSLQWLALNRERLG